MFTQSTKDKIKPSEAAVAVLGSAISLYIVNLLLSLCVKGLGLKAVAGNIIMWAYAIALFVVLLRRYCIVSVYELDGVKICFSRVFIARPRLEEQILLRQLVFLGSPKAAAERFSVARTRRFTSGRSSYAAQALIYKRENKYYRVLFNPNKAFCERLSESIKENR